MINGPVYKAKPPEFLNVTHFSMYWVLTFFPFLYDTVMKSREIKLMTSRLFEFYKSYHSNKNESYH